MTHSAVCESCGGASALESEELCPDCVARARAIVLSPDMRAALAIMVADGPDVGFSFDYQHAGAEDCEANELATYDRRYRSYTATALGRAALTDEDDEPTQDAIRRRAWR